MKVYLDTSVISYLDQKDASERMKEAQDMWGFFKKGRHDVYISDIVVYETNECRMENVKF